MKRIKIIYYIVTALLSLILLFSAGMYFFNHVVVAEMYTAFGYPTYIIYPYGIAKVLAVLALWIPNLKKLKEWAYAGLFFAFILAFFAHFMIGDGEQTGALVAMTLLILSYISNKKINS
jgi:hypothetical protein